jgi:Kef-type K+ transport system membrane component KefB
VSPILQLLLQISILVAAAKLAGLLSTKLGQPAVLGEILVGLLLGPSFIDLQALPIFTASYLPETIDEFA